MGQGFGTIAKYRVKPGHDKELTADMERFEATPPQGWRYHTVFRSTEDPNEIWLSVVFDSEEAYKRNANSPEMDAEYRRLLQHLDAEPEWHDGHVIHEGMHKAAPH
jgi:quinol monooxygenase YgiN